jgi:hypothetical protein
VYRELRLARQLLQQLDPRLARQPLQQLDPAAPPLQLQVDTFKLQAELRPSRCILDAINQVRFKTHSQSVKATDFFSLNQHVGSLRVDLPLRYTNLRSVHLLESDQVMLVDDVLLLAVPQILILHHTPDHLRRSS